ncbi:unnamed protein product, partial [Linum tenue]
NPLKVETFSRKKRKGNWKKDPGARIELSRPNKPSSPSIDSNHNSRAINSKDGEITSNCWRCPGHCHIDNNTSSIQSCQLVQVLLPYQVATRSRHCIDVAVPGREVDDSVGYCWSC